MNELSKRESIGLVAFLILLTLSVSTFAWRQAHPAPSPLVIHAPAPTPKPASTGTIVVHVAGAVKNPSVYTLPQGARAIDAVKMAGGVLPNGDPNAINLAEVLQDGQKLTIPIKGEPIEPQSTPHKETAPHGHSKKKTPPSQKVNLNTATAEELQQIPGIGAKTAEAIIAFRKEFGGFHTLEDLKQLKEMGGAKFQKVTPYLKVN